VPSYGAAVPQELRGYFNSSNDATPAKAKAALASLVAAGCDERSVLQNLYLFCGGNPEEMNGVRRALNFKGSKKRMLAIAALLQKTSSEIRFAERLLADLGLPHTMTPDCAALDMHADFLNRVGRFAYAEKCDYAVSNPTKGVAYLAEGSGRTRVVSFEEESKYLSKAKQPLKDIAQIILDTGLRREEAIRIRVENLDFTARTIFNPFGNTKAATRKITMTDEVYDLLKHRATKAKGAFVFPSKCGPDRPIGSVRKGHDLAIEVAGITDHFRLYDLRHTFATRAVASGVDLPTLSAMLGHTSIQMTMRYVHPAEEQKKIAAGKLEAFRVAGIVQATEKSRALTTILTTVN
jgi:integrase